MFRGYLTKTNLPGFFLLTVLLLIASPASLEQDEVIPHNEVKNWALKLGVNLWEYGKLLTAKSDLEDKYKNTDIEVSRKDGLILIRELAAEVKNMMDFKMGAVMRIMDSAEQAALSPQSDNGQQFSYYNAKRLNVFAPDGRPVDGTREMILTPNPHFDHLPVNTSYSSVVMPNDIEEIDPDVRSAIQWSEHLDPLFANNYEGDPSLSWQYFGSSTGFLRRYPGIAWPPEDVTSIWRRPRVFRNVYDFRSSDWYVTAATSPKDLVVLVDNSGSMTGKRAELARAIVGSILNTLTDNDFVNVYKFSDVTEETAPCSKDVLVQANSENVRWLKESMNSLRAENIANFTSALITGFEILLKYNRSGQGCQCNQAIMLITDGPPSNYEDIFKTYNFPHMPVRVFTYLVGKDTSSASEMHWMACKNKGYYARVENVEDVDVSVLHYIEVMSRPMVMYQNDHPIQWTPAFVGGKADSFSNNNNNNKQGQLMTSVTTPVFDRRNHSVRVANLLGVVGTDVSIDQIKKLVPPYKLGVNGYSFIVNNNGHVLYHPDLRPLYTSDMYGETLQPTYSSIDLTEVELVENENGPRENHSVLLDLRQDLINQKEGETELSVKIHYDNMKRVTTRRYKYFYHSIDGTPFSLGLAIPEGYGMHELLAEQEIKHSQKVTEHFSGDKWKVHPDWVYCEYSSGSSGEQTFKTPEERVLHFLARSKRPGWKWMSLRPRSPSQREHHHQYNKQDKEAYFCDKTLLQSLVLDAMVTEDLNWEKGLTENKQEGHKMFGLKLTFVATRSGLLRWVNHTTLDDLTLPYFFESNVKATDETWYKRAVDQYAVEQDSFVYSVPFDAGATGNPLVTATHAVFIEHKGHRAPAAVVGLQYQHATLAAHFSNITSACTGSATCRKTCASADLDCYVLDNNGFIIISENTEHTGKFFGQIDGTIMDSLVQDRIYKKVAVYDYQGVCTNNRNNFHGSGCMLKPTNFVNLFVNWLTQIAVSLSTVFETVYGTALNYPQDDDMISVEDDTEDKYFDSEDFVEEDNVPPPSFSQPSFVTPAIESDPMEGVDMSEFGVRLCDRKVDLYVLQPDRLNTSGQSNPLKGKLTNCHYTGCERPFSVQKVPHSNLILLVVDTSCPCGSKTLSVAPQELIYDNGNAGCLHKPKDSLYRRRPPKCINYHPEEIEIHQCGATTAIGVNVLSLLTGLLMCLFARLS